MPWAVLTMNSQRSSSTGFTPHELFLGGQPACFFKAPLLEDFKSPVGDWLEHKQSMANQAGSNLRHIGDRELSRQNCLRQPANCKVGDLVLLHHSRLPSWPRNCPQDPYFGPYRIIRIDGSRIHVRCCARLGGELLCAPKQFRHYHSPDDLSWDEWRLSDSEVKRIDLENAASPEGADELEEMTADEMAVDGYYVVAGIARDEYKQGWKFLTLWDGFGLSEATWEPMSTFIQPHGSINPILRSYLVENNEGQLLTRAETLSQHKKKTYFHCFSLLTVFYSCRGSEHSCADMPACVCESSCNSCPALHRRTGPLAPRDNHSLAEGHWFYSDNCFQSTALTLSVPCSPMPMVSSVNQVAAYQVCSHRASVCLVDHVLHGNCPDVMTLGSQRRTVAYYSRGD